MLQMNNEGSNCYKNPMREATVTKMEAMDVLLLNRVNLRLVDLGLASGLRC
jgi:hypothetical protein